MNLLKAELNNEAVTWCATTLTLRCKVLWYSPLEFSTKNLGKGDPEPELKFQLGPNFSFWQLSRRDCETITFLASFSNNIFISLLTSSQQFLFWQSHLLFPGTGPPFRRIASEHGSKKCILWNSPAGQLEHVVLGNCNFIF